MSRVTVVENVSYAARNMRAVNSVCRFAVTREDDEAAITRSIDVSDGEWVAVDAAWLRGTPIMVLIRAVEGDVFVAVTGTVFAELRQGEHLRMRPVDALMLRSVSGVARCTYVILPA